MTASCVPFFFLTRVVDKEVLKRARKMYLREIEKTSRYSQPKRSFMLYDFTELFCFVDDFCGMFVPWWDKQLMCSGLIKRNRKCHIHLSEIVTIVIGFHKSGMKCFKSYYCYLLSHHGRDFNLVHYARFVALIKRAFPVIAALLYALMGKTTEIHFVDSTPYKVSHTCRRYSHKVFAGIAATAKTSTGWFHGLKLHFIFNTQEEVTRLAITPGNIDDRKGLKHMVKGLVGKIFGDRGYISAELFKDLFAGGLRLVTRLRKNMKNMLMDFSDRLCLGKRMGVETIFSSIKSCGTFEHARHRNVINAFCHILSGVIAYQLRPTKTAFFNNLSLT